MKRKTTVWFCLIPGICCFLIGCSTDHTMARIPKGKPEVIPASAYIEPNGGAHQYGNRGDHPDSRYYVNPDFYAMQSDERIILIERFKTYQQTSEWSCGPAAALMVLWHFGITEYAEWDIAVAMKAHTDRNAPGALPGSARQFGAYGTSVAQMVQFFSRIPSLRIVETSYREDFSEKDIVAGNLPDYAPSERGNLARTFSTKSLYTAGNDDRSEAWVKDDRDSYFVKWLTGHLIAGRPILVEWADWGGHWQVIIGYDNNGTPGIGDDILIFADPYDTSDHWQDGYFYYPLERWFQLWSDTRIAPKPYQLQPYLVVELRR